MDQSQFQELTQTAKEGRHLEFKQSTPWQDAEFKAKITKSILAFSNVRDGGAIVIGVERQQDKSYAFTGMQADHLATYNDDDLNSHVSRFADPYVTILLDRATFDSKTFLVILINEFDEIPVICKSDGLEKLRKGAIYTRPYRMPETAEVPTQTELREILDMAIDKGLKKFVERQNRLMPFAHAPQGPTDSERFDSQLRDLQ